MIYVLHVVTDMNRGGLETMIMNYYRHIDRTKVQFHFLTHRDYLGDYGNEIESLGGKIYHLPKLNPLSIHYKKELTSFFDRHQEYKIVHVHQDCMSSVILREAEKHNVPVRIAHSHSSYQDKNLKFLIKLYYKRLISKYATQLFACSEDAGVWMFGGASFEVVKNAIDAHAYQFDLSIRDRMRNELNIPKRSILVGHVGRFDAVKNHSFLIEVFSELQKKSDAMLLLVGEGSLKSDMQSKVNILGLNEKVIFTGLRSDVAALMQAMDIFILPSLYEGLPVTIVEAQASGLPCLISENVPLECEMVEGLVHQRELSSSISEWVQTIIELSDIKRVNTYETISMNGFDINVNAKNLQDYYLKEWNDKCQH